jgi:hypothetical protein
MTRFGAAVVLCAAGLLAGCGDSMVIKDDDATFTAAQERLQRTLKETQKLQAPAPELALFLQAESFYFYRFAEKSRSPGSYTAEAAAAVTNLPAFQSMAGSLDLLDLRYRTPDNAAQLWETLLERHPESKLRSLTLYRLGWAYRSVGAKGLPRDSPNHAFDQLIKEQPGSTLARLASEAKSVPWKSKSAAMTRSIIPGGGQLYLDKPRSGWIRISIAALAVAAILTPTVVAADQSNDLTWRSDWGLLGSGLLGLIVLSSDYSSSYQDAMNGVTIWNERAEAEFDKKHPEAP